MSFYDNEAITIDGAHSPLNRNDYVCVFVYCANCQSSHHQHVKKGHAVTSVPCTRCNVQAIAPHRHTYDVYRIEKKKMQEKKELYGL